MKDRNIYAKHRHYLHEALIKYIPKHARHSSQYLTQYYVMSAKSLMIKNLLIFIFQYLIILNMDFTQPAVPLYPPIGLAFTMFYVLGPNAFLGLFLGGLFGYLSHHFSFFATFLYLSADLGMGYLGATLCQKILSQDIKPFAPWQETLRFLKINAFMICPVSGLLRIIAWLLSKGHDILPKSILRAAETLVFYYIDFCLADLNAIVVISSVILSWVYVFDSREKISVFPIPIFVLIAITTFLFFPSIDISYVLLFFMMIAILWALVFGYLVGMALMFIMSTAFLMTLMRQKQYFLEMLGLELYTIFPLCLLLFACLMLWIVSNEARRRAIKYRDAWLASS